MSRHFWMPCFGLFGLLTLHKSHNPMFRDHLPACQPSTCVALTCFFLCKVFFRRSSGIQVFEGRDEHTTLDVSGIGGTCTGHADVKVDIAVRLAAAGIWMDLGCFPLNFLVFSSFFPQGYVRPKGRFSSALAMYGSSFPTKSHQKCTSLAGNARVRLAEVLFGFWEPSSMNLTSLISRNYF